MLLAKNTVHEYLTNKRISTFIRLFVVTFVDGKVRLESALAQAGVGLDLFVRGYIFATDPPLRDHAFLGQPEKS